MGTQHSIKHTHIQKTHFTYRHNKLSPGFTNNTHTHTHTYTHTHIQMDVYTNTHLYTAASKITHTTFNILSHTHTHTHTHTHAHTHAHTHTHTHTHTYRAVLLSSSVRFKASPLWACLSSGPRVVTLPVLAVQDLQLPLLQPSKERWWWWWWV